VVDTHICRLLQGVAEWGCELQCIGRRHAVDARVCSALLGIAGSCRVWQGVAGCGRELLCFGRRHVVDTLDLYARPTVCVFTTHVKE